MNAGLTLLSDDDLAALRDRVASIRAITPELRESASGQLAAIDLEQDRRLSTPKEDAP